MKRVEVKIAEAMYARQQNAVQGSIPAPYLGLPERASNTLEQALHTLQLASRLADALVGSRPEATSNPKNDLMPDGIINQTQATLEQISHLQEAIQEQLRRVLNVI